MMLNKVQPHADDAKSHPGGTPMLKVGQAVVQAFQSRDGSALYEIVRILPKNAAGELCYVIRSRLGGVERVVREREIRAAFP
jgi:hypothetical protein